MADGRAQAEELKRRKVRKGTHSCWECRRRKIRCQFTVDNELICLPCQARGSVCRSQEFIDEARPPPQPDRRMAQRLGRLEEMMARLVERIIPESSRSPTEAGSSARNRADSPTPSDSDNEDLQHALDGLEASVIDDTPVGLLLGLRNMNSSAGSPSDAVTPESGQTSTSAAKPNPAKYEKICKSLHALFPSRQDIDIVTTGTPGGFYLMAQFFSFREVLQGLAEPAENVGIVPPITAHPSVLARRLLGLCVCIQQLPPNFPFEKLQLKSLQRTMSHIVTTVTDLVTSNDDLAATAEGLQSLVLLGLWHSNAGNLRKAWLNHRRALSVGQLVGIDRDNSQTLRYVDIDTKQKPRPEQLWYRIVACDRGLSLLLGLPVGTTDNSFASEEAMRGSTEIEKLERLHAVVSAKLIDRNNNKTSQAYALTQAIDCELGAAERSMGEEWWEEPVFPSPGDGVQFQVQMGEMIRLMRQVGHYDLLVLLHLPFMLRDPTENRYDYSKATCARASREVLKRFIVFRNLISGAYSCRHIDYSALIAAMTLLLSYLRQSPEQPFPSCAQRAQDRKLVEVVRERMEHVAVLNQDKLSRESASIINQMMPILDSIDAAVMGSVSECGSHAMKYFTLNIPYLGTVNIHPGPSEKGPAADAGTPGILAGASFNTFDPSLMQTSVAEPSTNGTVPAISETMDFTSLSSGFSPNAMNGMFMELEPQPRADVFNFPGLTAEAEDWTFQGVDTTYWSLLNNTNFGGPSTGP
ncbi:hypothetical protein GQ53DRAFT_826925 [Thozetella sp. PMI_491]|nr:hypothetical protein GQ53DRAFT_826925 [Thozetella sp. PMI_491]